MVDVEGESWAPQVEDDDGHFDVEELLSLQSLSYLYEEEDPSTVWYYTPEEENTMQPNEEEEESSNESNNEGNANANDVIELNKRPMLSNKQRQKLVTFLLSQATNLKVPRGLFNKTAAEYGVNRSTIYRIWKDAKRQMTSSGIINVKHKKKADLGGSLLMSTWTHLEQFQKRIEPH